MHNNFSEGQIVEAAYVINQYIGISKFGDALGVAPEDCDIVFAYPWPGEEACVDAVFARHASSGALLLTFHDRDRILLQRKLPDSENLQSLGWM